MDCWVRFARLGGNDESPCRTVAAWRTQSRASYERRLHLAQRLRSPAITDRSGEIAPAQQVRQPEIHPEVAGMLALHSLHKRGRIAAEATPALRERDHQSDGLFLDSGHAGQPGEILQPLPPTGITDAVSPGLRIHAPRHVKGPVSHLRVRRWPSLSSAATSAILTGDNFISRGHAIRVVPHVSQAGFAEGGGVTPARTRIVDLIALAIGIAAQAYGFQSLDQVQIGAGTLELPAELGGTDIGLLQDAVCLGVATLFL